MDHFPRDSLGARDTVVTCLISQLLKLSETTCVMASLCYVKNVSLCLNHVESRRLWGKFVTVRF